MLEVRSPEATRRATATESEIGPVMLRVIVQASMTASDEHHRLDHVDGRREAIARH